MVGDVHTERDAEVLEGDTWLARVALRFTAFTERWLPDAFGFVLVGTFLIFALGLATGESPTTLVDAWGQGFWSLIQFTLQMAMIIIGGYAVAVSAPVARLIARMAQIPESPRAAIAFTAAVAMLSSYLNWAFSLIFTAILAKEIARVVRGVDYRALGAMAFLGLGTVWAQGLSGSAALQVAGPASSPEAVQEVIAEGRNGEGIIPLTETIFTWQSVLATFVVFVVAVVMAWFLAPSPARAKTAQEMGIELRPLLAEKDGKEDAASGSTGSRPGDWLERSPLLTVLVGILGLWYLVRHFTSVEGNPVAAIDLDTVNLVLILLALCLHWRPIRMVEAVRRGPPRRPGCCCSSPSTAASSA